MMPEFTINRDLLERISNQAAVDNDFRDALLNNPRAALENEFNLKVPESMKVVVHEANENVLNIIIPT